MLDIWDLSKTFRRTDGPVAAVRDVSLSVRGGEFVALMGPSGSGKSTVLLSAGGLLVPEQGKVVVDGQDVYALPSEARARLRARAIGFVFQQFHLIPYLDVLDNVLAPSLALRLPGAAEHARELVEHFGLAERLHHVPAELSTGERQRTALARALLHRPKLLLADEPTGNLDAENSRRVLAALRDFSQAGGAVLLVTHFPEAAEGADRVVKLERGSVVGGA